jgi:acetyl-CoA acetyltransferase
MGQTAELVAHLFHISRRQADEYAAESQQIRAGAEGRSFQKQIEPRSHDGTF